MGRASAKALFEQANGGSVLRMKWRKCHRGAGEAAVFK